MVKEKNKASNMAALIVGIIVFLALFAFQGKMSQKGNMSLNGIIAQLQVLISTVLVITNKKRGFISAMVLNAFNGLFVLIITVIMRGQKTALPGVFVAVCTIITMAILYIYLAKTVKMHNELNASYEQEIENNRIIKEKDEVLQYLAYYDRLTQMPNRHLFMEKLDENINNKSNCTIIYADIDDFKKINDGYGHSTGDTMLTSYGERIEKICGDKNFAARIGGDEFGIILNGSLSENEITKIFETFKKAVGEPVSVNGGLFGSTMSFGIATFPNDGRSSEEVFRCAETAMFKAKENGKNMAWFYRKG